MKRVCAWCGRKLEAADQPDDVEVTHGLCQECRRRLFVPVTPKKMASPLPDPSVADDDAGNPAQGRDGD